MTSKHADDDTPLLDLIFCLLMFFVLMWVVQLSKQQDDTIKDANVLMHAAFMIHVTWPLELNDDVDIFLEDPLGNLIYYKQKKSGLMHVDRDDLGHSSGTEVITDEGELISLDSHSEIITISKAIDGLYIFNLFMYSKRAEEPTEVTVQMIQLSPHKIVMQRVITLTHHAQEVNVAGFEVLDGRVIEITEETKVFVAQREVETPF